MSPQLAAVADDFRSARERLHRLRAAVPAERWSERTHPERWSVAECVAHLNLTSEAFRPLVEEALARGQALARAAAEQASGRTATEQASGRPAARQPSGRTAAEQASGRPAAGQTAAGQASGRTAAGQASGRTAAGQASGRPAPARYRRDFMGWLLWRTLGPPVRLRVRTVAAFVPQGAAPADELVATFDRLQDEQLSWVEQADGLLLGALRVRSPFDPRGKLTYNLYSCLSILPRHQHRHLWQAERVHGFVPRR